MQDLGSPTRIEPVPPEVEVWNLNHWTAREVPLFLFFRAHTVTEIIIVFLFVHWFIIEHKLHGSRKLGLLIHHSILRALTGA